ncbi:hypothetical protein [Streptomyces sp. NPDC017260]|uniref:hypothetical protein n=1 Tax=unclassified Streptomyces TaxID=2593676 RepID=UPI00379BB9EF
MRHRVNGRTTALLPLLVAALVLGVAFVKQRAVKQRAVGRKATARRAGEQRATAGED